MRIAVIGSGIAGLGAAWALSKRHEVVLFEKAPRPGGHAHTVDVYHDGARIAVDTGFIVYNEINYPNLVRLFARLGVPTQASDMSFGVSLAGGRLEWAGDSIGALFAQKRNIFRPSHHAMWMDILRFNRQAPIDLAAGALEGLTLGAYLERRRLGATAAAALQPRPGRDGRERQGAGAAAGERVDRHQAVAAGGAEPQRRGAEKRRARTVGGGQEEAAGEAVARPQEIEQVAERAHGDGPARSSVRRTRDGLLL
jgi:phytoene dehydrogenase-like protein